MLKTSFESQGNWLFKNRSHLPVVLFIAAVPAIYFFKTPSLIEENYFYFSLASVLISFIGIIVRAISIGTTPKGTSGRNTDKQVAESLNSTGIYSMVRHPLYLGNFLIWIGIVIYTFNFWFFLIVSLAFWVYYERIMYAEECFLEKSFGETFVNWSKTIPAFIPSFEKYKKSVIPFSFISVLRREYSGWLATAIGFAFIDFLRHYFFGNIITWKYNSFYVMLAVAAIALILRSIKHYTKLFIEKDRS